MDALERTRAQQHSGLLARLRRLPQASIVDFIEANDLPAAASQWDLDTLRRCVEGIEAHAKAPVSESAFVLRYRLAEDKVLVLKVERAASFARAQNVAHNYRLLHSNKGMTVVPVVVAEDLQDVPLPVLMALVSQGTASKHLTFSSKETAMAKAKEALPKVADVQNPPAEASAPAKKTAAKKTAEPRTPKPIAYEPKPKDQIKQVRKGTKISLLIDLLAKGTTLAEIEQVLSATGRPINARAWLGYDLHSVAGYGVTQDEKGILHLKLPAGMKTPLEHKVDEPKPVKTKKAPEAAPAPVTEIPPAVTSITEAPSAKASAAKKSAPAPRDVSKAVAEGAKKASAKKMSGKK